MGMYDIFNGEQEKIFPWYTISNTEHCVINSHGGDLKYYGNGSSVPYRSLSRNYTKNFIVLDIDIFDFLEFQDEDDVGFIIHIIENGILLKTIYSDKLPENISQ